MDCFEVDYVGLYIMFVVYFFSLMVIWYRECKDFMNLEKKI